MIKIWIQQSAHASLSRNTKNNNNNIVQEYYISKYNVQEWNKVSDGNERIKSGTFHSTDTTEYRSTAHEQSIFMRPIVEDEISKMINRFGKNKSADYDGIRNLIVKGVAKEIVHPLSNIQSFVINW